MRISKKIMGLAALFGLVASFVGVMPFGEPAQAAAPPELFKDSSAVSVHDAGDPDPNLEAIADCNGREVVGGGAWANDGDRGKVRLTKLEPTNDGRFIAAAEAPVGFDDRWTLQAYAICAPSYQVPGHHVVASALKPAQVGNPFLQQTVGCPDDQLVIGTGSRISTPNRQVGLQLNRSSGPMDIARSTAREDDGTTITWQLQSYAICVDHTPQRQVPGQHVEVNLADGAVGDVRCKPTDDGRRTFVHSVGGGGGTSDSGRSWLQVLYPSGSLGEVTVAMTPPTSGVAVYAICAW